MNSFKIDDINKTVIFNFSFNEDIKNKLKNIDFNSRYNKDDKSWTVPVNEFSKSQILSVIKKYNFKLVTETTNFEYSLEEIDYDKLNLEFDSLDMLYKPREYQLDVYNYALNKGSFINGSEIGVGKTYMSIMYAEKLNKFPCLVVVPSSVKYNWKEKWEEITKGRRNCSVIESNGKKNDWNSDVVIINYDLIGKRQGTGATVRFDELILTQWSYIISDESHFLKSNKSQRSKAFAKIVKKSDADVHLLTGTPVLNKPIELYNLLKLIDKDKLISKDWMHFVTRYCGGYKGKFGFVVDGATNLKELNYKLKENCYIRHDKDKILKDLPSVIKQATYIEVSNKSKIKKANKDFIKYITETKGEEAADKAMEALHLVKISELRKLSIEGKLKQIDQYLKDWKETKSQKLLIFGIHKEGLQFLSNKYKSNIINGGLSSKKKQEVVNNWKEDGNQFLFANIQACGTGTDGLQNCCSNMIIIELPWTYGELSQVIGRLYRSGQKNIVNVQFMISKDTIDVEMLAMLNKKEVIAKMINEGKDVKKDKTGLKYLLNNFVKRIE